MKPCQPPQNFVSRENWEQTVRTKTNVTEDKKKKMLGPQVYLEERGGGETFTEKNIMASRNGDREVEGLFV